MGLLFLNILAVLFLCGFHPFQSCALPGNDNEPEKNLQGMNNAEQTQYLPDSGTSGRFAKGLGTRSMANTPSPGSRGSNTGSVLKGGNYGRFKRTVGSGLTYSSKGLNTKRCQGMVQKCCEYCKGRMKRPDVRTKGLPDSASRMEKRASNSPSQVQDRRSETSSPSGRKSRKRMSGLLDRPLWRRKSVSAGSINDPKEDNNPAAKKGSTGCLQLVRDGLRNVCCCECCDFGINMDDDKHDECIERYYKCKRGCRNCLAGLRFCLCGV